MAAKERAREQAAGPAAIDIPSSLSSSSSSNTGKRISPKNLSGQMEQHFKRGRLSAKHVQEAMSSVPSSYDPKALGTGVDNPKNAHRDLTAKLSKHSIHAELYETDIRMWDRKKGCQVKEKTNFLLPYEEFDILYKDIDISNFTSVHAGSGLEATVGKWKEACNFAPDDPLIGIGVWGDTAPVNHRNSLAILLWNTVTGIFHERHPFVALSKLMMCQCGCKGRCTFEDVFRVMLFVLIAWQVGSYPFFRDDGVAFAQSNRPGDAQRTQWAQSKRTMKCKGTAYIREATGHG